MANNLLWQLIKSPPNDEPDLAILMGKIVQSGREHSMAKNLAQVMDCTPGSLYWKDLDGRYLGCNMFMVKTAGLNSTNDIIGSTDLELWPAHAETLKANDDQVIRIGKTLFIEENVNIGNGESMFFTSVKIPLKDEYGNTIGVIGNSLDITKLKKIEKELKIEKEKADISNKVKSEFIHNMEHDIRTPLNGVWGFANILADKEQDTGKRGFLTCIANCAKELLNYCDSILDFSRVESGAYPIFEKPFSVRGLIDEVVSIELVAANNKGLRFSVSYNDLLPKLVMGDNYRLKRVLLNLVSNAIKFTNEGYIDLIIDFENYEPGNKYCIFKFTLKDSGVGISEDKQHVIYEKFTRGTASNRGLYKGQGLGLRIVKQFVTEMDGEVHLKSERGKGTTFTVLVPFKIPITQNTYPE